MFTDQISLTLIAGKGGRGIVAWRREKFIPKGGPAGGNGGNGGSIHIVSDPHFFSLECYTKQKILKAENGQPGSNKDQTGKSGQDLVIKVPKGTVIKDSANGEILFDFSEDYQSVTLCQGGIGGKGNSEFATSTHQAPIKHTEGTLGETKKVDLELKLIADIGLVGFPNAGKSTLFSHLTKCSVQTGAYPFTTLYPNLGLLQNTDYSRYFVADIPGIIENAHQNRGLGLAFLRHVERTKVLVFVVDLSPLSGREPYEDFSILRNEMSSYKKELLEKPFLVVLNKIDEEGSSLRADQFKKEYPFDPKTLFTLSALTKEGIDTFHQNLYKFCLLYTSEAETVSSHVLLISIT